MRKENTFIALTEKKKSCAARSTQFKPALFKGQLYFLKNAHLVLKNIFDIFVRGTQLSVAVELRNLYI